MTLKNNKTIVTFEVDEVLLSRQISISKWSNISIKIEPGSSWDFIIAKVDRLISMDDEMFEEMSRISKIMLDN